MPKPNSCTRKQRYPTAKTAWLAINILHYGKSMHVYKCDFCHKWHIGHKLGGKL